MFNPGGEQPVRATYIHGVRDVRTGEETAPEPAAGEVLVQVAGIGVCGSDLHYYLEGGIGSAHIHAPFIPGHEFAGWIVHDHPALGLRRGQLVAVDPARPCGHCEWCERGDVNLCPNVEFTGAPPFNGAMTELIAVDAAQIHPVPDHFTPAQAMMLEPLGVAIQAMDLAHQRVLESVAVIGCGTIGLCLLQLARRAGAEHIYAVDPCAERLEKALSLGADTAGRDLTCIEAGTDGRGCDLVLEATNDPAGLQLAVDAAAIGGRAMIVGIPDGNRYALDAAQARRKGLVIKFIRRMGHVYPRAIRLVAAGEVDVDAIVTHRFPLEQADEAFRLQTERRDGVIKSLIVPRECFEP